MSTRRLLFLDATQLTAYRWQKDGPVHEAAFAADANGFAAFDEYLHRQRASLFYLLADVADESFQIEDIPHVQGGDRHQLISRKLAQYYYGTPLSLALSLGRNKEGRRDERMLFAGLTGYAHFEPWLRAMREAETQLVGIYSTPLVIAGMVGKLAGDSPVLVMSVTHAGLRQTFLDHGRLRFSRLTPMATGMIGDLATACATETRKIFQYLAGQRMVARDVPLRTLVLAHPSHFGIIGDRCRDTAERQVALVDLLAESKKFGLAAAPQDSRAETLLLHLLVRQTPLQQFAPAGDRRPYRLWQTRFALNVAAAGVLGTCLLVAGGRMISQMDLTEKAATLQAEIDLGKRRYDEMLRGLPAVGISPDNLRILTDRYSVLERRSPGPEPLLQHIAGALNDAPKVELTRLEWRIANRPDEPAQAAGARGAPPASVVAGASGTTGGDGYAIVTLQAQLPVAMASDHRSQLETVNALVAMLGGKDLQVQVISLPFETESGKAIRSTDTGGQVEPPKFVLRLVQKL